MATPIKKSVQAREVGSVLAGKRVLYLKTIESDVPFMRVKCML